MTTTLPAPGTTARFDLGSGDSFIGKIVEIQGDIATIENYSAWYAEESAPYQSPYLDDSLRFRIDDRTRISAF